MFLLAVFLPPVAVFLCGKPFQAILSIFLTICFWFPGIIHALFVVQARNADERTNKLVDAMKTNN